MLKDSKVLMHKDIKVCECKFDNKGYLKKVGKIFNEEHLPLCVNVKDDDANPRLDLQRWLLSRNIAVNRRDVAPLKEFYGSEAFQSSNGVSLFDCYWFAAPGEEKSWEDVSPYRNWDPKSDTFYLMFAHPDRIRELDLASPNLTIPGRSARMWFKKGEDFCLLHGDAQMEMAAYRMAGDSDIVAKREYKILSGQIFAVVDSETSEDVERISLEDYYNSCQDPSLSKSKNLAICCEKYGIPNWKDFVSKMVAFDNAIGNTSRELGDVGVLRNPDTLEIIRFAKL